MTAAVVLAQVLNETGVHELFSGSRQAMELALHPKLQAERTEAARRERGRIRGMIAGQALLYSGNTKEEDAVRRVLDGIVHKLRD